MGRAAGTLGNAPAAAAEGAMTVEGLAAEGLATTEEPAAGRVGPWSTCGQKEWAPFVFGHFRTSGKAAKEEMSFSKTGRMNCELKMKGIKGL